jgi:hypothetical protein
MRPLVVMLIVLRTGAWSTRTWLGVCFPFSPMTISSS